MFGVGPSELLVILVIALLVLGPKRLPELARSLGKAIGEFRRATADITSELDNARVMLEEETRAAARATREPARKGRGYEPERPAGATVVGESATATGAATTVEPRSAQPPPDHKESDKSA